MPFPCHSRDTQGKVNKQGCDSSFRLPAAVPHQGPNRFPVWCQARTQIQPQIAIALRTQKGEFERSSGARYEAARLFYAPTSFALSARSQPCSSTKEGPDRPWEPCARSLDLHQSIWCDSGDSHDAALPNLDSPSTSAQPSTKKQTPNRRIASATRADRRPQSRNMPTSSSIATTPTNGPQTKKYRTPSPFWTQRLSRPRNAKTQLLDLCIRRVAAAWCRIKKQTAVPLGHHDGRRNVTLMLGVPCCWRFSAVSQPRDKVTAYPREHPTICRRQHRLAKRANHAGWAVRLHEQCHRRPSAGWRRAEGSQSRAGE
ncbi:hypothetical protein QBC39DRAFT_162607 [Podospora conica]|nr:hypothetical protein QBC39DRAFT_162607 [Schizothecium conicum]